MTTDLRQSHRLRTGRRYLKNHVYHLTTVTYDRTPVFNDLWAARSLVSVLRRESEAGKVNSIAFVIMPDHLHWLLQSLDGDIAGTMRRVKARSARMLGGRIWQAGYHDRCLRHDEDVRQVARYVIANPVRAGLVDKPGKYPHWDACFI